MNFTLIPLGSSIFLDANVLIYSFVGDPTFGNTCTDLLVRIKNTELQGFISASLFSEIAHRMMTLEACKTFGWPYQSIARNLRRRPDEIKKLQQFRKALDDIVATGIQIVTVTGQDIISAGDLSIQHGLLSGDALLVAVMQKHGFTQLASNDADFDRVPGITRYSPV